MPFKGQKPSAKISSMMSRFDAAKKRAPAIVGTEARNFFVNNFRKQAFVGSPPEPWKERKNDKKGKGRAILIKTGKLRNSIRVISVTDNQVQVGTDMPYAQVHNEGLQGNINISQHNRVASRKVGTSVLKLKGRQKRERLGGKKQKIRGASYTVKAHSRKANTPRRKFIGSSPYLNARIKIALNNLIKNIK